MNVPLLTNKNQGHIIISNGTADETKNTNVQLSFSPINHLGLMANYTTYSADTNTTAYLGEGAMGYYYSYGNKAKLVADIYAGYGTGKMHADINASVKRFFIQPGVGLRTKHFDMAFNVRLSNVSYYNVDPNGHTYDYLVSQNIADIDKRSYAFLEPCFTLRGGFSMIKFQIQFLGANALGNVPWRYEKGLTSAGVYVSIEDLLRVDPVRRERRMKINNENNDD